MGSPSRASRWLGTNEKSRASMARTSAGPVLPETVGFRVSPAFSEHAERAAPASSAAAAAAAIRERARAPKFITALLPGEFFELLLGHARSGLFPGPRAAQFRSHEPSLLFS